MFRLKPLPANGAATGDVMKVAFSPPLDVPQDMVAWMREHASQSAFLADMLRVISRTGGLTQRQLDMVRSEQAKR